MNDLLDFSRIEAGKLELDVADFSLVAAVGDPLRALAVRTHKKGVELVCHVQPDLPDALACGSPGSDGRRGRRIAAWDPQGPGGSLGDQDRASRTRPGGGIGRRRGVRAAHPPPRRDRTRPAALVCDLQIMKKDIGQIIIMAHHEWKRHVSRIRHHPCSNKP
jgi:hypothetical protein